MGIPELWYKNLLVTLASVAQLVGVLSHNQKVVCSIPSQGTYLGCGSLGLTWSRHQMMFLSHQCFSPSFSLKAMKICLWVRIRKKILKELRGEALTQTTIR